MKRLNNSSALTILINSKMIKITPVKVLIFFLLFLIFSCSGNNSYKDDYNGIHLPGMHDTLNCSSTINQTPDTVYICIGLDRLSDLDFRNQEYSIEFLCKIVYSTKGGNKFNPKQLMVLHSKKINSIVIDSSKCDNGWNFLMVKYNCIVSQKWDMDSYPFDSQKIEVCLFNPALNANQLVFVPSPSKLNGLTKLDLENGWGIQNTRDGISVISKPIIIPSIDYDTCPSFSFTIPLSRSGSIGLFFKLFVGMYVAFLVAFIAFFIPVYEDEPRFGLPVGALFAAIANKYVVESILPESPQFSILVDGLHLCTFISIVVIIAMSGIALVYDKLFDKNNLDLKVETFITNWVLKNKTVVEKINRKGAITLLIFYIALNFIFFFYGMIEDHFFR